MKSRLCVVHTHMDMYAQTHSLQMEERDHSMSRQVLKQKKKRRKKKRLLAVPFPLAHREAWPKHTGTLSSLQAIHIILSVCSL